MIMTLDATQTMGLAIVVLLIGMLLVKKISFLEKYCIPAPVIGGIVFSILILIGHQTGSFNFKFDTTIKSVFMICFFTTIGFCADFSMLKKGGINVVLFLVIASVLAVLQNVIGVGLAFAFKVNPLVGMATGSIPMTGGNGTAAAFGPLLEKCGLVGGTTIANSAAVYGLVAGCLIGGPIAKRLIEKNNLKPTDNEGKYDHESLKVTGVLSSAKLPIAFFEIGVAVGLGSIVSWVISRTGFTLPAYIGSMLVAAALRNIKSLKIEENMEEINALGGIFLAVFLAEALMSLQLWTLAALAIPMIVILLTQTLVMAIFAYFITFKVMGRDYDAAVMSAGHCGFGLGATTNAVANMTSVVGRYFPSPKSFFVIPIVGGLFIDLVNALIITGFVNVFK